MGSLFMGLSIFMHSKLILLSGGLIFSSFWYIRLIVDHINWKNPREWFQFKSLDFWKMLFSLAGPWLFFLYANIAMKFYWIGAFAFDGVSNKTSEGGYLSILGNPLQGWLGQWLDFEMGLLWSAPALTLIIPGLFLWFSRQRSTFLLVVPATLIYLVLNASYSDSSAGFSPVGRYLLVAIPLFLPSLAWVLWVSKSSKWLQWIIFALVGLSLALSFLIPFVGRRGLPYYEGYNIYSYQIPRRLRRGPKHCFGSRA